MTKIFLYIAAALLLGSTVLSFLNKGKLATKQADIDSSHAAMTSAQGDVTRAKADQKKAEKAAADALANAGSLQTQLTTATTEASELKPKLEKANTDLTAKQGEVDDLNKKLADMGKNPTPVAAPPDVVKQLDDANHKLAELQVVKESLDTQAKTAQAQVSSLQKRISDRERGESMNGLHGRVLAVDRNWNFVVLDLGGRNGVNSNATMVIQRGGSMVGRVKITSVEPSQSIADIVPNSVPAGVSVQPGDTVVFSGS